MARILAEAVRSGRSRGLAASTAGAAGACDLDLGAGDEARLAVGHHALALLEPLGHDRFVALGSRDADRPDLHRGIRLHDEDVRALLTGLYGLRRHHQGVGL